MSYIICNKAGTLPQCQFCPGATILNWRERVICPFTLNYGITKFMGKLTLDKGKWFVTLNTINIPITYDPEKFCKVQNQGMKVVAFINAKGAEVLRKQTYQLKTH